MAEITLRRKVTLRRKEEEAAFTFTGKLKVKLLWSTETDQDLCLFFKKKDGSVGGVFSEEYRQNFQDLGSLDEFPFMLHLGDDKEPEPGGEAAEQINVASLEDIETAYVCIVNYKKVMQKVQASFAQDNARVELQSDSGDYLEVLANSEAIGHVYLVCTIHNRGGEFALKNEGKVYSIGDAFDEVPGFELICKEG
ncbi:MAG: hypothetical protein HUK09_02340 [Bacteroidaceae bacterium]|nr:hypothetical protein [Bacteroidaceae bacterium]